MSENLTDDVLDFLWRLRRGEKQSRVLRHEANALAVRIVEVSNGLKTAPKASAAMVEKFKPNMAAVGMRKLILEKTKSPPRREGQSGRCS
jgi:hypothetical protein